MAANFNVFMPGSGWFCFRMRWIFGSLSPVACVLCCFFFAVRRSIDRLAVWILAPFVPVADLRRLVELGSTLAAFGVVAACLLCGRVDRQARLCALFFRAKDLEPRARSRKKCISVLGAKRSSRPDKEEAVVDGVQNCGGDWSAVLRRACASPEWVRERREPPGHRAPRHCKGRWISSASRCPPSSTPRTGLAHLGTTSAKNYEETECGSR